jgi:choline dehydrogenase-like flavoprotein
MPTYSQELPVLAQADVVVLGSGSAGSTAAIAAARTGADTLLVERYGFLGGTSTSVLYTFYGFYTPGKDTARVVNGIPWEIVERLAAYDMVLERPQHQQPHHPIGQPVSMAEDRVQAGHLAAPVNLTVRVQVLVRPDDPVHRVPVAWTERRHIIAVALIGEVGGGHPAALPFLR